jgi:hypothetical protein
MVEAMDSVNSMLLPDTLYCPEYRLQPDDPPTVPSSANSAVMVVFGTGAAPFKLFSTHTWPVNSPPACEPAEAQAARNNKAAIPTTMCIVLFIIVILSRDRSFSVW